MKPERFRMKCRSCGALILFEIRIAPDDYPQRDTPGMRFYCPVCSSAERTKPARPRLA